MSLFISSLASGSNGNCYYIGNSSEAILVDVGISCREIEKRMNRLNLSMEKVKAVFISHEHSDHIRGLEVLAKRFQIPVYSTSATLKRCGFAATNSLARPIKTNELISIGELAIAPFSKFHDAVEPCSFMITHRQVNVGVFTDIGSACQNVTRHFSQCHAAFLETNYDDDLLEKGNYPYHLKKRIRSGFGHLSNKQALTLFMQHKPAHMSHLFLAHLSKNNNCPELVLNLFQKHCGCTKIILASRFEETAVYEIIQMQSSLISKHHRAPAAQLELLF